MTNFVFGMYSIVLIIHSAFRWLVLGSILYALLLAYRGWMNKSLFSGHDNFIRHFTATVVQIQLLIGITLYFVSPTISSFLQNYKEAVHQRDIRFFGMEHSVMMFAGIITITIGSMLSKRKSTDRLKFKTIAMWYSIGLLIILTSIPWPFSPLVSRPFFRF